MSPKKSLSDSKSDVIITTSFGSSSFSINNLSSSLFVLSNNDNNNEKMSETLRLFFDSELSFDTQVTEVVFFFSADEDEVMSFL